MTIKSIDMQVLVQKVGDVAKIQQAQQTGNNHRQEEFIKNINEQTDRYTKTVNKALQSEHKKVHEKEEKENQSRKRYKGSNKQENEETTDNKPQSCNESGSTLDIII
ncbi:MAG: hypothetical protein WC109_02580 [Syntrophomonadaceae bacterium]|nr:hypothetical protein [Syntrophomonadaceae bacterium]MDD3897338.1 hypothetical protein [Syntrophomonadaceae bacterium]MDD4561500.1 hypothetical protein [Syntrophomonadaceae bacterium]